MKQYFKGDSLQKVKFNRQICVYWRQNFYNLTQTMLWFNIIHVKKMDNPNCDL